MPPQAKSHQMHATAPQAANEKNAYGRMVAHDQTPMRPAAPIEGPEFRDRRSAERFRRQRYLKHRRESLHEDYPFASSYEPQTQKQPHSPRHEFRSAFRA